MACVACRETWGQRQAEQRFWIATKNTAIIAFVREIKVGLTPPWSVATKSRFAARFRREIVNDRFTGTLMVEMRENVGWPRSLGGLKPSGRPRSDGNLHRSSPARPCPVRRFAQLPTVRAWPLVSSFLDFNRSLSSFLVLLTDWVFPSSVCSLPLSPHLPP